MSHAPSSSASAVSARAEALPVSPAIGLARLICILGIVYVHGWTGLGGEQMAELAATPQGIGRWTVVELFGRAAVPLLTMVSGWLVASSIEKRGAATFLSGKARAILLPMLLWNLIAVGVVTSAAQAGLIIGPYAGDLRWMADNLLGLTRAGDVNVQMAFLRDLFLCMLAAPLLVRLRGRWLALVMAVAIIWVIGAWNLYLLLRPSILLFFIAGILARRHGIAERVAGWSPWQAALPFLIILPFKIGLSVVMDGIGGLDTHLLASVDLVMRAAVALLVWRLAIGLVRRPIGRKLLELERYAFFLFCSHLLFMWLVAPEIGLLTGTMGSTAWLVVFVVQPILALGFAILLARATEAVAPFAADLLSGGRLGRDQIAMPAARPLAQAH